MSQRALPQCGETSARRSAPANYLEAFETLAAAGGIVEGITPPPDATAYTGNASVNATLTTLKNGLVAWPNTVGPACRTTPSLIVNWDPGLQADLDGLQQAAALPPGPGRDQQVGNFAKQILAILESNKSAIDATAAGLVSLALVIGINGSPVLSILQRVQSDIGVLQAEVTALEVELKLAEAPYPIGNPDQAAALQQKLATTRKGADAAAAWGLILCRAYDQFAVSASAVQYLSGIWLGLQTALNGAIATAQLLQQNPSTISSSGIAVVDKAWSWLKGEMQGIAQALNLLP